MNLKLGALDIKLSGADLSLSLNSVPSLRLLTEEKFDESIIKEILVTSERAKLEWQGESVDVLAYGFDKSKNEANESEAYIYALILNEAFEDWLVRSVEAPTELNYGIYQNQAEVGGWTFLNGCLANQVLVPINDYKERIDKILPIASCLTRPIYQDNQQFLNTVICYLQLHLPELVGWTAIHAEEEALRLVFFDEENAFELDSSWENISASLPIRFVSREEARAHKAKLRKTGLQVKADKKMALLKKLAEHGLSTALSGFLEVGSETELLYVPGPVKLAEKFFLCETISYSFDFELDALAITLSLESGFQVPASSVTPCMLEGHFKAWDEDDSDEIRVFLTPPDPPTWQLMDPKDSDLLKSDGHLMAEFVLPTTPKDDYAEFYVRRVEGDKIIFELQAFHTPIIYGSQQVLNEQLEAATLSINTEILALSVSDKGTAIEDTMGIVFDKDKMMQRSEQDIFIETETIILNNNVEITENKVDVKSKTEIANDLQVDGKLEVGGM